jgi:hypothetical protein
MNPTTSTYKCEGTGTSVVDARIVTRAAPEIVAFRAAASASTAVRYEGETIASLVHVADHERIAYRDGQTDLAAIFCAGLATLSRHTGSTSAALRPVGRRP